MWFPGLRKLVRWRVNRLWRKGQLRGAEKVASRFAEWRPSDRYGWWVWGNVLYQQHRSTEAERVLRRGLENHPHDEEIAWLLSRVLIEQGNFDEARHLLEHLRTAHQESRLPFLGLIELAVKERAWTSIPTLANKALERTPPNDPGAKYELGLLLALVPDARDQAVVLLREAAAKLPRYPLVHVLLGVLLEEKDETAAREHISRARRLWRAPIQFDEFLAAERRDFGGSRALDSEGS
jgi:predicted Zn-dependent protease